MKKKILYLILAGTLVVSSMTACSTKDNQTSTSGNTISSESENSGDETTALMKEVDEAGNIAFDTTGFENVTLGEFKNVVPTSRASLDPTEQEIEDSLNYYLDAYSSEMTHVEKAAESGDYLNVSYTVTVDGEEQEEVTETINLGYEMINEGIDQHLTGLNPGDEIEVETTYSENFYEPALAGKTATIKLKLNWVGGNKIKAEYTDEFVNNMTTGVYKTTAEFDQFILDEIAQTKKDELFMSAWEIIINNAEAGDLSSIVEEDFASTMDDISNAIESSGMEKEEYWNMYGGVDNEEDFNALVRSQVEESVKERAVVYKMAEENGITVSETECMEQIETTALNSGYADAQAFLAEFGNDYISDMLLYGKIKDFVIENQLTD